MRLLFVFDRMHGILVDFRDLRSGLGFSFLLLVIGLILFLFCFVRASVGLTFAYWDMWTTASGYDMR